MSSRYTTLTQNPSKQIANLAKNFDDITDTQEVHTTSLTDIETRLTEILNIIEPPPPEPIGEVKIYGALIGNDASDFQYLCNKIRELTNIKVIYTGSTDFENDTTTEDAPERIPEKADILLFPQPGAVIGLSYNKPLSDYLDEDLTFKTSEYLYNLGKKDDGKIYGCPNAQNLKGLIWYRPSIWEQKGYEIPTSMEDLFVLAEKMKSDGNIPWSVCIGSGGATGWVVTDWIENLLIRKYPSEVYDRFVTGDLSMNSPEMQAVLADFGKVITPGYYNQETAATTYFGLTLPSLWPGVISDVPNGAMMTQQASFIKAFAGYSEIVTEQEVLDDIAFFPMPPYKDKPAGVVGGGDMLTIVAKDSQTELVKKVMPYLVDQGLYNNNYWENNYGNRIPALIGCNLTKASIDTQIQYRTLLEANVNNSFRFDASDQMPPVVNLKFWEHSTQLVSNGKDYISTFTTNYDKSWTDYKSGNLQLDGPPQADENTVFVWVEAAESQPFAEPLGVVGGEEVTTQQLQGLIDFLVGNYGLSIATDPNSPTLALDLYNDLNAIFVPQGGSAPFTPKS